MLLFVIYKYNSRIKLKDFECLMFVDIILIAYGRVCCKAATQIS